MGTFSEQNTNYNTEAGIMIIDHHLPIKSASQSLNIDKYMTSYS